MPGGRPPLSEDVRAARVALGQRLRHARENASLTQDDLATATALKAERISEWEDGKRPLPAETLLLLAQACGVTASHILGEQKLVLRSVA